jgi:hypothetical protein
MSGRGGIGIIRVASRDVMTAVATSSEFSPLGIHRHSGRPASAGTKSEGDL